MSGVLGDYCLGDYLLPLTLCSFVSPEDSNPGLIYPWVQEPERFNMADQYFLTP